jgi:hypothetical protein
MTTRDLYETGAKGESVSAGPDISISVTFYSGLYYSSCRTSRRDLIEGIEVEVEKLEFT